MPHVVASVASPHRFRLIGCLAAASLVWLAASSPASLAQERANVEVEEESTAVEGLLVKGGRLTEVPIPNVGEGAPALSVRQMDVLSCRARQLARGPASPYIRLSALAGKARNETLRSQQLRRDAAAGNVTMAEVEVAELERQKAVTEYQEEMRRLYSQGYTAPGLNPGLGLDPLNKASIDRLSSDDTLRLRFEQLRGAAKDSNGMVLDKVSARFVTESNVSYLIVTGEIRNPTDRNQRSPSLLVTALDARGHVVDWELADARAQVAKGGTIPFAYRMINPPIHADQVRVSFAPRDMPGIYSVNDADELVRTANPMRARGSRVFRC